MSNLFVSVRTARAIFLLACVAPTIITCLTVVRRVLPGYATRHAERVGEALALPIAFQKFTPLQPRLAEARGVTYFDLATGQPAIQFPTLSMRQHAGRLHSFTRAVGTLETTSLRSLFAWGSRQLAPTAPTHPDTCEWDVPLDIVTDGHAEPVDLTASLVRDAASSSWKGEVALRDHPSDEPHLTFHIHRSHVGRSQDVTVCHVTAHRPIRLETILPLFPRNHWLQSSAGWTGTVHGEHHVASGWQNLEVTGTFTQFEFGKLTTPIGRPISGRGKLEVIRGQLDARGNFTELDGVITIPQGEITADTLRAMQGEFMEVDSDGTTDPLPFSEGSFRIVFGGAGVELAAVGANRVILRHAGNHSVMAILKSERQQLPWPWIAHVLGCHPASAPTTDLATSAQVMGARLAWLAQITESIEDVPLMPLRR